MGEHPLSYHSQNSAIIAESTGEIKAYATSPPLPLANLPGRGQHTHTLPVLHPPRRSQAKAGTNALAQGTFFLDTDQRIETFPVRI